MSEIIVVLDMQARRIARRAAVSGVIKKYEPDIRKVTAKRKKLVADICELRERDKVLWQEQVALMFVRDAAVEDARIKVRDK